MHKIQYRVFLLVSLLLTTTLVFSQWTNRYPKVEGFSHHVYLEGFELPVLSSGPMYASSSPDGRSLAFSAKGWIWILDLKTLQARRITFSGDMDAKPQWSPDGRSMIFIRDEGDDTSIILLDLNTMNEKVKEYRMKFFLPRVPMVPLKY